MKLPFPFYRLPLRFDTERLRAEVGQFSEEDWQAHPTGFAGNSAIRLISVDGTENDGYIGTMAPTQHLQRCPYLRQILAGFGVCWSRSRLMRLGPGAEVPEHTDHNHHWFFRVRVHIPIITGPEVSFTCDQQTVNMKAGEAWLFDNWRMHSVHNGMSTHRVHFVADTVGNSTFWQMVGASQTRNLTEAPAVPGRHFPFRADVDAQPSFERFNVSIVMPPSEVDLLSGDLLADLRMPENQEQKKVWDQFVGLVISFRQEWRMLWMTHGESLQGWRHFQRLRDRAIEENAKFPPLVSCASNRTDAADVFHQRILLYCFTPPGRDRAGQAEGASWLQSRATASATTGATGNSPRRTSTCFERPVFIVAAPRSGSTAVFEAMQQARDFWTVGGEAHGLVEGLPQFVPVFGEVQSNRLDAAHVDDDVRQFIHQGLTNHLRDRDGRAYEGGSIRLIEKTPKNSLRIPFFNELFPDAKFIFLWRDPRENISSIIEAWRSGGWVTYPQLPGWQGPWSLLLPPEWQGLRGAPLEQIAAHQWKMTNQIVLDDLSRLPRERWSTLRYSDFITNPGAEIQRLCAFAGAEVDDRLKSYLSKPLPMSAHTLTPPAAEKWKANAELIERILPMVEALESRLLDLHRSSRS